MGGKGKDLGASVRGGMDIDYEAGGEDGRMLMVSVSGTAGKTHR